MARGRKKTVRKKDIPFSEVLRKRDISKEMGNPIKTVQNTKIPVIFRLL